MATNAPASVAPATFPFQQPDRPVTDIEGVAVSAGERLANAGLATTQTFYRASTIMVVRATGAPVDVIQHWRSQAQLLDLPDLEPKDAYALVRAGIRGVAELAAADAETLQQSLTALEGPVPASVKGEEGKMAVARWVAQAKRHPGREARPPRARRAAIERVIVISTGRYVVALLLSLLFLFIAVGAYRDYLPSGSIVFYQLTLAAALIIILWTVLALGRRGRVVHRTVAGTKKLARGISEGIQSRGDVVDTPGRTEGGLGRKIAAVGTAIVWIITLPFRILTWAWYTTESLVWRIILVAYDIVYYPILAAWLIVHWAVRTSIRIIWWALGIVWKVPKQFTRLPGIRTWWRRQQRPKILASYRAFHQRRAHNFAIKIEKGRRLSESHGRDPNRWEEHYRATRGFPFPHPEHGRVRIRRRIAQIRRRQNERKDRAAQRKARREGRGRTGARTPAQPPQKSAGTVEPATRSDA